jgi:hypothetical protein
MKTGQKQNRMAISSKLVRSWAISKSVVVPRPVSVKATSATSTSPFYFKTKRTKLWPTPE